MGIRKRDTKEGTIAFRVTAELKDQLRRQAKAQRRSMSSYIEWLIVQDGERIRLIERC